MIYHQIRRQIGQRGKLDIREDNEGGKLEERSLEINLEVTPCQKLTIIRDCNIVFLSLSKRLTTHK